MTSIRFIAPLLIGLASVSLVACPKNTTTTTPETTASATVSTQPTATTSPTALMPPLNVPPVTEGDVTQATVNGVTVLVKRVPGAELAAMHLYVRGGVRNWSQLNAGVEQLAVATAAWGGTQALDRDSFSRKLASMGSDIGASSGADYSVFAAKSLTSKVDETFGMMVDAFRKPALPASEIEVQRQTMMSRLRREMETPDARVGLNLHKMLYRGHPYEHRPSGTMETVPKLTKADLEAHLEKLHMTSRLLLVVVGDVTAEHVIDLVRQKLGDMPQGDFIPQPLPGLSFEQSRVEVSQDKLPTNYVVGVFDAPTWTDADFFAGMIAMEHLGFRVFEEVRTKQNLSYAPHASFSWATGMPLAQLYVTAVDPNKTIKVMYNEVATLKTKPLTEKQLAGAQSTFLTKHLMSSEATDSQASWLARAQIYAGDWRFEKKLLDNVKAVTVEQVTAFANKYLQHIQVQVLGPANIDQKVFGSL